jgi:hypothetical protein
LYPIAPFGLRSIESHPRDSVTGARRTSAPVITAIAGQHTVVLGHKA